MEGSDDQKVFYRLYHEVGREEPRDRRLLIDTAQMIRSNGATHGNREKVEIVHALAFSQSIWLAAVVDRELRGFLIDDNAVRDTLGESQAHPGALFWTRGHSIENYFCETKYLFDFLIAHFPEHVEPNLLTRIDAAIQDPVRWGAAISLSAIATEVVSRLRTLPTMAHWRVDASNDFYIDEDALANELTNRGAPTSTANEFKTSLRENYEKCVRSDLTSVRWAAHGHILWRTIWSWFGVLLSKGNTPAEVCNRIAHGEWDSKLRHCADRWAPDCMSEHGDIPLGLIEWMQIA